MPRLIVVANGASGPGNEGSQRARAIRKAFLGWGADPGVLCVKGNELEDAAEEALATRPDVLVAAGGDGTVSCLAGAVAGTRTALAVLPLGTLNHFAKDAGIPLDLHEAARVAVQAPAAPVDVGEANGRVFVNNASLGIYPDAVEERERRRARGGVARSKGIAMVQAAGTVLRQVPAHHLRLSIDGRPAVRTTSFVFVGNNAYETGLGRLGKRGTITGGELSLYTVRRPGRRAVLGLAARALVGRLDEAHDFEARTARELIIDCRRPSLRVALDGEVARLATPLVLRTRPGALRLVRDPPQDEPRSEGPDGHRERRSA